MSVQQVPFELLWRQSIVNNIVPTLHDIMVFGMCMFWPIPGSDDQIMFSSCPCHRQRSILLNVIHQIITIKLAQLDNDEISRLIVIIY